MAGRCMLSPVYALHTIMQNALWLQMKCSEMFFFLVCFIVLVELQHLLPLVWECKNTAGRNRTGKQQLLCPSFLTSAAVAGEQKQEERTENVEKEDRWGTGAAMLTGNAAGRSVSWSIP